MLKVMTSQSLRCVKARRELLCNNLYGLCILLIVIFADCFYLIASFLQQINKRENYNEGGLDSPRNGSYTYPFCRQKQKRAYEVHFTYT